jgi:hypothetical protein
MMEGGRPPRFPFRFQTSKRDRELPRWQWKDTDHLGIHMNKHQQPNIKNRFDNLILCLEMYEISFPT